MGGSFFEDQSTEVFRHMIRIALLNAGGLPAKEVPLGIRAEAVDSIEVHAPARPWSDGFRTDRTEWNARRGVPNFVSFVDASSGVPAGTPGVVVALMIEINGQIDPVAGRCDLKLAVMPDVCPIVTQEHFHDVAIPKSDARKGMIRRGKQVQH